MKIHIPLTTDKIGYDNINYALNHLISYKIIKDYELLSKDLYIFFDNDKIEIGE